MKRFFMALLVLHAVACDPYGEETALSEDLSEPVLAPPTASAQGRDATLSHFFRRWAEPASLVAIVEVVDTDAWTTGSQIYTLALLRVDRVLRDDNAAAVGEEFIELEVPGGELGDWGQLDTRAPLLLPAQRGLIALTLTDEGWAPAQGNRSFIGFENGLEVCLHPDPEAAARCAAADMLLLPSPGTRPLPWPDTLNMVAERDLFLP